MWFGFQRREARRYFFGSHSVGKVTDVKSVQERVRMKLVRSGHPRKKSHREVKKRTWRGKKEAWL